MFITPLCKKHQPQVHVVTHFPEADCAVSSSVLKNLSLYWLQQPSVTVSRKTYYYLYFFFIYTHTDSHSSLLLSGGGKHITSWANETPKIRIFWTLCLFTFQLYFSVLSCGDCAWDDKKRPEGISLFFYKNLIECNKKSGNHALHPASSSLSLKNIHDYPYRWLSPMRSG